MASRNAAYHSEDEEGDDEDYDEEEEEEEDEGDEDYDLHDDPNAEPAGDTVEARDHVDGPPRADESSAVAAGDERREGCGESGSVDHDGYLLPNCPVCFEPWNSEGPHRVCCIPCGHVYGRSCLERWVQRCGNSTGKCPQCNREFKKKEIINLYAPLIAVRNDDLEKELHSLREKNDLLNLEKRSLIEEFAKQRKHQIDGEYSERQKKVCLEQASLRETQRRLFEYADERSSTSAHSLSERNFCFQNHRGGEFHNYSFILQRELVVGGLRVLGIDASSQILVVAGKAPGVGAEHILRKISMLGSYEADKVQLPPNTGAVRDLCILPGSLVLLASLGKKLSLFSMESNHLVLKYDLPAPAWSCSSDLNSPYHIYTGLQNGMLMVFDLRQTAREVESIAGLSTHPIHTIQSLVQNNTRKVLTASSLGPCVWDVDGNIERPSLVSGMENEGVCISLACNHLSGDVVASFRPKIELISDSMSSQTSISPSPSMFGTGKLGSHVLIKGVNGTHFERREVGYGHVSEVRMSKSTIVCSEGCSPLFAYGDELSRGVSLLNLPSFNSNARLKPHHHPILDLKYACSAGRGLLACASENKLQLFSCHAS